MCLFCFRTGVFTISIFQMIMGYDLTGVTIGAGKKEKNESDTAICELKTDQGLSEKTPLVFMCRQNKTPFV